MKQTSQNITSTVKQSSKNSLLGYDYLNAQVREQMISTMKFVNYQDSISAISSNFLEKLIQNSDIKRIRILDRDRNVEFSTHDKEQYKLNYSTESFINSNNRYKIIGANSNRYLVRILYQRAKGGVIIADYSMRELIEFNRERGIGNYLNSVVSDSSIFYIAIQNEKGILAASKRVDSLSAVNYDSFLKKVINENVFDYRFSDFKGEKIYEAAMPFSVLDKYSGVIRIGLDFSPIQKVQESALWNVFVRVIILIILGFIVFSYAMSRNTVETLQKEKERMTEEVYELQKYLREKEKQNAIHHLASGVAHEIGNPLNALSLTIQRLKRKISDKNEEVQNMVDLIKKEINRIEKIIQKFLNFSKPLPLNKEETNLSELTDEVINIYKNKLDENGVEVELDYNQDYYLYIDREKIKQCYINLIENSIEALENSDDKRINIELVKKDDKVEINFSDNGTGIEEENLSKIFNLYFSTKKNGTGIGLTKVYKIIRNHDGEFKVDSKLGEGTTFSIQLPLS
ncbi:MAG: GHKL domain-containing protein [Candidatus Marinimicrobia bacterium]|nr:GHKL domain-containing protein [Candidatus Neomarinimicrobiota bacterium]